MRREERRRLARWEWSRSSDSESVRPLSSISAAMRSSVRASEAEEDKPWRRGERAGLPPRPRQHEPLSARSNN